MTRKLIESFSWEILNPAPYSPDLSPRDFRAAVAQWLGYRTMVGCELLFIFADLEHFPEAGVSFLVRHHVGGYQSPQEILTPSFLRRGKRLSSDNSNLY
ncbi:hypothetical protein TNCV_3370141 [Trichonephila clavipes]|nr:hypothetical protein TNCV_3370141 [Trichonephila clavipes]